jgi:hypothetical protein
MADSGAFGTGDRIWQRANIMAAASYLRERLAAAPHDRRLQGLYEGLLEVLDPSRRAVRARRVDAAPPQKDTHVAVKAASARRAGERRSNADRRRVSLGPPELRERRTGRERRARDRRNR